MSVIKSVGQLFSKSRRRTHRTTTRRVFRPKFEDLERRELLAVTAMPLASDVTSAIVSAPPVVNSSTVSMPVTAPRAAAQAASIQVLVPANDVWDPGRGAHGITWTTTGIVASVKIELSRDGGQTWSTLFASVPNNVCPAWTVSGPATTAAQLRLTSVGNPFISGVSPKFTIIGPYYRGIPGGYCTEFAARQFDLVAPSPGVNWGGNAGAWYQNAAGTWKETADPQKAQVGAIMVWRGGAGGTGNTAGFGHVAIVTDITRDAKGNVTQLIVREQNVGDTFLNKTWAITNNFAKVTTKTLFVSNLNRTPDLTFVGFILPVKK